MPRRALRGRRKGPRKAVISPLPANLYLHRVLDLWVNAWRKKVARGERIVLRYAGGAVLGFQYREEAGKFLEDLRERVRKFGGSCANACMRGSRGRRVTAPLPRPAGF
jgi:hypothetical protein